MTLRHTLLALLVVVLWGANFVIIDEGLEGVPPLLFLALRFVLVALPAVFFVKPPKAPIRVVVAIGAFMSLGQFSLLYVALHLGMPAGLASLLLQVQVIFTVLIAAFALKERPTRRQIVGVVIGTVGLGVVIGGQAGSVALVPAFVLLGAALSWAIGNVITRSARVSSGLSIVVWSALVVPIPSFLLALAVESPAVVFDALASLSLVAILSTAYTAVAASLIGYGIWNSLMAIYPASRVAPFTLLVPIIGLLAAWLVQGEVPTVLELVGGVIMLAGIAAAVLAPRRRRDAEPAPVMRPETSG